MSIIANSLLRSKEREEMTTSTDEDDGHHPNVHRLMLINSPIPPPQGKSVSVDSDDRENGLTKHQVSENSGNTKESRTSDAERPPFKRHPQATPIELFYDLFFVANLNAFNEYHDVISNDALSDYVGFFGILWLTWFQTSLHDVRFSWDSVVDRSFKSFHFGFMVAFAPVGANFFPSSNNVDGHALSLILMGSRLTLFLQYAVATYQSWAYAKTRVPMITYTVVNLLAAMIYLGIAFDFPSDPRETGASDAYVAFYIVGGAEAILNLLIAGIWRAVSFKGTHIVERLGLLTLIILGEGIILLCKVCITVWDVVTSRPNVDDFPRIVFNETPGVNIALVLSSVLILYFYYQSYFDTQANEHFGTIKQKLYALVHFPIHAGLALFVVGIAQCVRFRQAVADLKVVESSFLNVNLANRIFSSSQVSAEALLKSIESVNSTSYFETAASQLNATAQQLSEYFAAEPVDLEVVKTISEGATIEPKELATAVYQLLIGPLKTVFENLELKPEFKANPGAPELVNLANEVRAYNSLFDLTYIYTYVGGGVALVLIGTIWWVSKTTKHTRFDFVRIAVWQSTGVTLSLLALLAITAEKNEQPGERFLDSDWILPAIMLILGFNLLVFHLPFGRHGAIVSGDY